MKKSSHKASSVSAISSTFQKLFVVSALLAFVMQILQTFYYMSLQYPQNDNFSAYASWWTGLGFILLIVLVLFATRTDRSLSLRTAFEVTLMTTIVIYLSTAIGWLTMLLPYPFAPETIGMSLVAAFYFSLPFMILLPVLLITIIRLRSAKQW